MLDGLVGDVREYTGGELSDDLALMALRLQPKRLVPTGVARSELPLARLG